MPTKAICHYFYRDTILPTLKTMGMGGDNVAELLLGTALVESRLTWRKQLGNGPARGLYQMEMATHDDIWNNYLSYRKSLADKVLQFKTNHKANAEDELINNDLYATAMARVHYARVKEAIPDAGDTEGMANYWKKYY
ncbi:MAG: hypothetical protein ACK5Q1_15815, partial [Limnobacter sp.]